MAGENTPDLIPGASTITSGKTSPEFGGADGSAASDSGRKSPEAVIAERKAAGEAAPGAAAPPPVKRGPGRPRKNGAPAQAAPASPPPAAKAAANPRRPVPPAAGTTGTPPAAPPPVEPPPPAWIPYKGEDFAPYFAAGFANVGALRYGHVPGAAAHWDMPWTPVPARDKNGVEVSPKIMTDPPPLALGNRLAVVLNKWQLRIPLQEEIAFCLTLGATVFGLAFASEAIVAMHNAQGPQAAPAPNPDAAPKS